MLAWHMRGWKCSALDTFHVVVTLVLDVHTGLSLSAGLHNILALPLISCSSSTINNHTAFFRRDGW